MIEEQPRACRHPSGIVSGQMDESGQVTGPVDGPPGIIMTGFDLAQAGYTLEEFFLEGTATSFEPAGPAGAGRRGQGPPAGRGPFLTRPALCRPSDPPAFTRPAGLWGV